MTLRDGFNSSSNFIEETDEQQQHLPKMEMQEELKSTDAHTAEVSNNMG